MKDCGALIVQLGIVTVPFAAFGGVGWLCDSVFDLDFPLPLIIAAGTLASFLVGFLWWMVFLQKKDDEIFGTIEHPFFGTVNQKRKTWECTMSIANLGSDLFVSSYGGTKPTEAQEKTVTWLSDSVEAITSQLEDCLDDFDRVAKSLPPRPRKIVFESLLIDSDEPNTCCVGFDIEDAGLPWGYSAFYANGKLDEFTDNH